MTAPDQPEPICGPSCDPMVCYVGHCALEQASDPDVRNDPPGPDQPAEHAASPAATDSNRQDLRDRLADAFDAEPHFSPLECACIALRVIQPVLDAKDAEIAGWRDTTRRYNEASEEWRKCAEDAERELATLRAYHQQTGDLP